MNKVFITICLLFSVVMAEQEMPNEKKTKWTSSELDVKSFSELVVSPEGVMLSKKPWFVKYYAPWCGHCKALEPIWEEFNEKHEEQINVGSVDCTTQLGQALCQQMEIRGFPTLVYYASADEQA